MSDTEILNEMMRLQFKIGQVLTLNYKADIELYRKRIEFLKDKLKAVA